MSNDCSERVCQFGLAHVDTPKGDLDMSGSISNANKVVVENDIVYPYGTTEQFPFSRDSDLQDVTNSAHYYMECSNKGTCDRKSGTCACYDGYDGAACQRASCPGSPDVCSGHGTCRTIKQLAADDYGNDYELWDKHSTMGCSCDKGYYGADCSLRQCKYGVDPLYLDDSATIKYSTFDFAITTTSPNADFHDGTVLKGTGYWAIRFYDVYGEDWLTQPIAAGATCEEVVDALAALPNSAIPSGETWCTREFGGGNVLTAFQVNDSQYSLPYHRRVIKYPLAFWEAHIQSSYVSPKTSAVASVNLGQGSVYGYVYRIKFLGNPGKLRQPEIEIYLDGKRPSLSSNGTVITKVWTDGQQGESKDYFADHCDGVTINLGYDVTTGKYYLGGISETEKMKLKTCLADADFDKGNNKEVYNWDYGSKNYPHLIKLIKTVTTFSDGGYYAALYFDTSFTSLDASGSTGTFVLLNPFVSPDDETFSTAADYLSTDSYEVYTTKATLALTSNYSETAFGFASQTIFPTNVTYDQSFGDGVTLDYDGDISCELGNNNLNKLNYVKYCLNKSDNFLLLNFEYPQFNPPHLNIYTAERIFTRPYTKSVWEQSFLRFANGMQSGVTYSYGWNYNTISYYGVANTERGARAYDSTTPKYAGSKDLHYQTHVIVSDLSTNWAQTTFEAPVFHVYKFFPSSASTYEYVAPCSNRGICNEQDGTCECFKGYSNDDCSQQNSLHV